MLNFDDVATGVDVLFAVSVPATVYVGFLIDIHKQPWGGLYAGAILLVLASTLVSNPWPFTICAVVLALVMIPLALLLWRTRREGGSHRRGG